MRLAIAILTATVGSFFIVPTLDIAQHCADTLGIAYNVEQGATESLNAFSGCTSQ